MKIYTTSREDYLKAVLVLQKSHSEVHSVDVARYLGFSKPSVSHAVAMFTEQGYVYMDDNFILHLTEKGRVIAEKTLERHHFFTRHLVDIGVDPKIAEEDACRLEHAISDESFEKLKAKLEPDGDCGPDRGKDV